MKITVLEWRWSCTYS